MKKTISIILVVVLMLSSFSTISYAVTSDYMGTGCNLITEDDITREVWSSDEESKFLYLMVSEDGLYNAKVTDNLLNGNYEIYIEDLDKGNNDYLTATSGYTISSEMMNNFYLKADHLYSLELVYYDDDYYCLSGDLTISFEKSTDEIVNLSSDKKRVTIAPQSNNWFEVKTTISGDYSFNMSESLDGIYIQIYEKNTEKKVWGKDSSSFSNETVDTVNIRLEENTEYLICVQNKSSGKTLNASFTKLPADIVQIDINEYISNEYYTVLPDTYLYEEDFDYLVTYSDGSKKILEEYEIDGLYLEYIGKYADDNEDFKLPGAQPVKIHFYNGCECETKVYVTNLVEFVSDLSVTTDFEDCTFENSGDDWFNTYFWRIKVSETGIYDLYSYQWSDIDDYEINFFDENGYLAQEIDGGWNLFAGKEYALALSLSFEEDCYDDFEFSVEPERDHVHTYGKGLITKPATCNATGTKKYTCKVCSAVKTEVIPKLAHTNKTTTTKATTTKDGKAVTACKVCGKVSKTVTIYKASSVKLSKTSYTYNGKVQKPTVTVKNSKGTTLKNGTDYTVSYASGCKNTGKYAVKITFKGNYSGSKTLYFNILPSKTTKLSASQTTSSIKATWKAVTGASGYKVTLYTSKGKAVKTVYTTKTTASFTKLSKGTTYKVRVTAYKTIDGKKVASSVYTQITTATKPGTPSLKVTAGTKKASLSWNKQTGASGYVVYMATSKNGTYKKVATVKGGTKVSYTKTGLTKGKTYYFKVRAYVAPDSKTTVYGDYSSVKSGKIK